MAAEPRFVPPDGKVLVMIGQDRSSIDRYTRAVKQAPAGVMFYTSINDPAELKGPVDRGGGLQDPGYLLKRYPHSALQIGLWMVGSLEAVARGEYDANIDELGEWIRRAARPVFLRIGYEFDFPQNRYEPAEYVAAFRHVVDRLRKNGVGNAAFVWHSFSGLPRYPVMDWYPGDDYVDWFGVSFFLQPDGNMKNMIALAREHRKPVMVAEATPFRVTTRYGEVSWKTWFEKFFKFVSDNNIEAISYINWDWEDIPQFRGQGWGDARIEGNAALKDRWVAEISGKKYLHASDDLFSVLGY
jgi:hypothetical protein